MTLELSPHELEAVIDCIGYSLDHAGTQAYSYNFLLTLYGKLIDVQDVYANSL